MEPQREEDDNGLHLEQDWDSEPVVETVYFKIFEFKLLRCPRGKPHDWTLCPFAHPTEKARRRQPGRYRYNGIACADFRKCGSCRRGDACPFAHGVFEAWLHPARYRTKVCLEPMRKRLRILNFLSAEAKAKLARKTVKKCNDGSDCNRYVCFFAHGNEELREGTADDLAVINNVKLQMEQEVLEDPVLGPSLLKIRAAVAEGIERAKKGKVRKLHEALTERLGLFEAGSRLPQQSFQLQAEGSQSPSGQATTMDLLQELLAGSCLGASSPPLPSPRRDDVRAMLPQPQTDVAEEGLAVHSPYSLMQQARVLCQQASRMLWSPQLSLQPSLDTVATSSLSSLDVYGGRIASLGSSAGGFSPTCKPAYSTLWGVFDPTLQESQCAAGQLPPLRRSPDMTDPPSERSSFDMQPPPHATGQLQDPLLRRSMEVMTQEGSSPNATGASSISSPPAELATLAEMMALEVPPLPLGTLSTAAAPAPPAKALPPASGVARTLSVDGLLQELPRCLSEMS